LQVEDEMEEKLLDAEFADVQVKLVKMTLSEN